MSVTGTLSVALVLRDYVITFTEQKRPNTLKHNTMLGDTAILHIWHIVGTQKIFVEGRKPVTSEEVKTVISRFFQINFLKYK